MRGGRASVMAPRGVAAAYLVNDCMLDGTKTTFSVSPGGGGPLTYFVQQLLTQWRSLVGAGECGSRKKTWPRWLPQLLQKFSSAEPSGRTPTWHVEPVQ